MSGHLPVDVEPLGIDNHGRGTVLSIRPRTVLYLARRLGRAPEIELVRTVGGLVCFGCPRAHHFLQGPQKPRGERVLGEPMEAREA